MKPKIAILIGCAAAAAAGCRGPVLLGPVFGDEDEYVAVDGSHHSEDLVKDPEDSVIVRKSLYITGVEYPEGVDWRGDIGCETAGCVLFLMEDGERVVEVPVGYDRCVSVDADMHRCIEGHLYTDFSTDNETVVGMDGQELFRYEGREMIAGMVVSGGAVYTLGVPRAGGGWTFRRDGQTILSRSEGGIVGGLYIDGASIAFAFREASADGGDSRYFVVQNGLAASISVPSDASSVDDIRLVDGTVNYIAYLPGLRGEWLVTGEYTKRLEESYNYAVVPDKRFRYDGKPLFITGNLGDGAGLWRGYSLEMQFDGKILGMSFSEENYVCVTGTASDDPSGIYRDGETEGWPAGYDFLYEGCVATDGERCAVGLVDRSGNDGPALWVDGEITQYNFNGFFTSLEYRYKEN